MFDFLAMRTSGLGFDPGRLGPNLHVSMYAVQPTRFSCDLTRRVTRQDDILCASLLRTLVLTRVLARDLAC